MVFPGLGRGGGGGGVRSGFGSTLHQTVNVREFLEETIVKRNIEGVIDVPCGDMHWMQHVRALGEGRVRYFGGDVSNVVVDEHRKRFVTSGGMMEFDVVDVVDKDLLGVDGVKKIMEVDGEVLLIVRHLMFHLNSAENVKVLERIEALSHVKRLHVMLSTYLISNENDEEEYYLATGHKINLFARPFCVEDPIEMVSDGVRDLWMGVWVVEGGRGLRREDCV